MNNHYKIIQAFILFSLLSTVGLFPHTCCSQSNFAPGLLFTEEPILRDLPASTAIAFTPDNTKIFLATKNGVVRVAQTDTNTLISTPFIDISSMVNRNTDRGLLGIALDPRFPVRPYVYLSFVFNQPGTSTSSRDPKVSRLIRVTADQNFDYNRAVPNSTVIILGKASTVENIAPPINFSVPMPTPQPASCMTGLVMGNDVFPDIESNDPEPRTENAPTEDCIPADGLSHTTGMLLFDKEGTSLFASFGDGSSYDGANRPAIRSLLKDSLAGKILRINPDSGNGVPGNPFYSAASPQSNRSKVWSYGLRNPFRFALHPATGQVFVDDVGSSSWEEVNAGKGANFGWPCFEGGVAPGSGTEGSDTTNLKSPSYSTHPRTKDFCSRLYQLQARGQGNLTRPIFSYAHPSDGAAFTGAAFYTGTTYPPDFQNALFFSDFAGRTIRYLTFDPVSGLATAHNFATEVEASQSGVVQLLENTVDKNIYALYFSTQTAKSEVRRFRYAGTNTPPRVMLSGTPSSGRVPLTVSFRSDGTSDPDGQSLKYRWDFGDGNSSEDLHPTHTYEAVGNFTVRLKVTETTGFAGSPPLSSEGSIQIRTGSSPPRAFITTPATGTKYRIGDTIQYSGGADYVPQENEEVTLTWTVLQHHNNHSHLVQQSEGPSGSFVTTEHADNTYYEVCLFAEAGEGLRDQRCVDIRGLTSSYTFSSSPPGAPIAYVDEDTTVLAPHISHPIQGSVQTIVASLIFGGRSFIGWSDGHATPDRTFTVGSSPVTLNAMYENKVPIVQIAVMPASGIPPLTTRLDGSGSRDPEGEPLMFSWLFPDGTTSTEPIVNKTFSAVGSHVVQLSVADRFGATATSAVTVVAQFPTPAPSPLEEPSPTPVPTVSVTLTPTTAHVSTPTVVPDPPKGKISILRANPGRCGSKRNPCAFSSRQTVTVRGTFPTGTLTDGVTVVAIYERLVGKNWKQVTERPAIIRSAKFRAKISTTRLKVPGKYRVRFKVARAPNQMPKMTAFQFFRF